MILFTLSVLLSRSLLASLAPDDVADANKKKAIDICQKAYAAIGKKEDLAKVQNILSKGSAAFQGMAGVKGELIQYVARPMKAFYSTEFPGIGKMTEGTDGEVFWENNGPQGFIVHEGYPRELKRLGYAAALHRPWHELFHDMAYQGEVDVLDQPCHKIEFTDKDGNPERTYFHRDTLLPVKVELMFLNAEGMEMPIDIYYSNWKKVNGVQHHFRREVHLGEMKVEETLTSIEHNVKLPEGVFNLPEEVKAIVAKKKNEGANKG